MLTDLAFPTLADMTLWLFIIFGAFLPPVIRWYRKGKRRDT